jgi:hypothetical protein
LQAMARSRLAEQLKAEDLASLLTMSAEVRFALAEKLGREGIAMYMQAYKVDFETAARALKKNSQAGRRYSRCMDDDAW